MKTLMIIKADAFDWLAKVFPERSPLLAPVCNKPLMEYLLDFSILCGCRHVRLATDMPRARVEAELGDGGRWGVELSYAPIRETDHLEAALLKNNRYCADTRLLVMQGCFFLHYDRKEDYAPLIRTARAGELLSCASGRILIHDAAVQQPVPAPDPPPLAMTALQTVGDLYRQSMRVLESDADQYVLPGYNHERKVYIGRNVRIARSARIEPPVMIGSHVQIQKGSVVGPNAVIGSSVLIDARSQVRQSVILDQTYVGEQLVLDGKLAAGSRLVDPENDTVVQLEDDHLLSPMQALGRKRSRFQRMSHGVMAALLWSAMAIPYALVSSVLKMQGRWQRTEERYWIDSSGRTARLARVLFPPSGFWGGIAAGLALDRYPLLGSVMRGDLALIGTMLLPATAENEALRADDADYQPGIFRYAEGEKWPVPDADQDIVNRFHLAHQAFRYDCVMMAKVLVNKLRGETAL